MIFGRKKPDLTSQAEAGVQTTPPESAAGPGGEAGAGLASASDNSAATSQPAAASPTSDASANQPEPERVEKSTTAKTKVHEAFGQVVLTMMAVPRYRHLSIVDLNQHVLEPLLRDRIAVAKASNEADPSTKSLTGIAIWATVSDAVDTRIREQIRAGVFPVRLKPDDWASGKIVWLLDVIAPSQQLTATVIANFRQALKQGEMRVHPIVTKLVDPETLARMGAAPIRAGEKGTRDGT